MDRLLLYIALLVTLALTTSAFPTRSELNEEAAYYGLRDDEKEARNLDGIGKNERQKLERLAPLIEAFQEKSGDEGVTSERNQDANVNGNDNDNGGGDGTSSSVGRTHKGGGDLNVGKNWNLKKLLDFIRGLDLQKIIDSFRVENKLNCNKSGGGNGKEQYITGLGPESEVSKNNNGPTTETGQGGYFPKELDQVWERKVVENSNEQRNPDGNMACTREGNVVRDLDSIGGGHLLRTLDSNEGGNLRELDHIGGGNLLRDLKLNREMIHARNFESTTGGNLVRELDSIGGGHLLREMDQIERGTPVRNLDSIGGGNLLRTLNSDEQTTLTTSDLDYNSQRNLARRLDSIGGGNLVRALDQIGGGNLIRDLDSIGGGHLIRGLDQTEGGNVESNFDSNGRTKSGDTPWDYEPELWPSNFDLVGRGQFSRNSPINKGVITKGNDDYKRIILFGGPERFINLETEMGSRRKFEEPGDKSSEPEGDGQDIFKPSGRPPQSSDELEELRDDKGRLVDVSIRKIEELLKSQ